jgi:ParB family chromosome partitioning protein
MTSKATAVGKYEEISIDLLDIGTAQVRTDLSTGIDDLVTSIRRWGLLQPIRVARKADGRYEILAGQRRFLACQRLGYKTIQATVVDDASVDEFEKVGMSVTENLIRRDNSQKELIDACTKLFKRYGSIKMVAQEMGLNPNEVSKYVKYDQLVPKLKELVDNARLDMAVALQAQRAATEADGTVNEEAAQKFASELAPMSNQQRKKFVQVVTADPTVSVEEKIERGRKQPVLKQIVVTLEESLHTGLQAFAKNEGVNQDEAAANLIEDGLVRRGFVEV